MSDPRWLQLGRLLVNDSAKVRRGERVMIAMGEVESAPLAEAVYQAILEAGGYPQVQFLSERLRHLVLAGGDADQIAWVPEIEAYGMEWADAYFGLRGAFDLGIHHDIPADRMAINQKAMGVVSSMRWEKTRWCLVRVPNAELARQADMPESELLEMFFDACLLDWERESEIWRSWASSLNGTREIRIVGPKTDLRFSVEGRRWAVGDGRHNMPDGEIATSPREETVDGHIFFEHPGVLSGKLLHDLFLRWESGTIVEARASTNEDFLKSILATDAGASKIGEFGIGTNRFLTTFCKDILLDEKIGGTVHIALGRAYPESGGVNQSAIHWDIIKDLRNEGAVYADGEAILKDGQMRL